MTPEKLLELLTAFRNIGGLTRDDYLFFDRKLKELEFKASEFADMDAIEIRLRRLIQEQENKQKNNLS